MSKNSLRRSIKTAQLKIREVIVGVAGTAGNTALGFDKNLIQTINDLGTGNYQIILKSEFRGEMALLLKGWSTSTAQTTLEVVATDVDRITVQCRDLAGVAADADIILCLAMNDFDILF